MAGYTEFILENIWLGVGMTLILFVVFYLVGWWSQRQTATTSDYYAAGFTIGPVVNGLAMTSTWASLATFMGVIALILRLQVPFVYLWIQWAISIPLLTLLYGTSLRRIKTFTPASFIKLRYGNTACVIIVIWMIIAMIMYALGQIIGLGRAFELFFGVPYYTAIIISGIATVGFVTLGGMHGASFNAAFQCVVMLLAMVVPMGAIMHAMGSTGWWFPPLAYGDMVPAMLEALPDFFDMRYDFRWYFALIPAFGLGPIAMPHLAMRVFTASSLKSARYATVWFLLFLGLLFSATYVAGFAGNYFMATTGAVIEHADQIVLILNVVYNPEWVTAFVIGGAIAAGLSTLTGNLVAISALVGSDLMQIVAPKMEETTKMKWGYVSLAVGGIVTLLLAFRPPAFLVISILWAFGLLATTTTPGILLGVWWKKANRLALIISSLSCGLLYIIVSPHVLPDIVIGSGLVAALGMSGGLVTIPLSFLMFIVLSLIFEKTPSLEKYNPTMEDKKLVDRIHGWGDEYDEKRYNWTAFPVVVAVLCVVVIIWGFVPWA